MTDEWIEEILYICVCVYTYIYIYIYIHTQNGILLSHKDTMEYYSATKNEIMPFAATWVDLEIIILSETSQKEKDKYHIISFIMWNLKHDTYQQFIY